MSNHIVVDSDYLLDLNKEIKEISSDILDEIINLNKVASDLQIALDDPTLNNFKLSFSSYVENLKNVPGALDSINSVIYRMAREFNN